MIRMLPVLLAVAAFTGAAYADPPLVLRDRYGRPTGTIERLDDGRSLLRDERGRSLGTVEQEGNSLRFRDWRGRPADLPTPADDTPPEERRR